MVAMSENFAIPADDVYQSTNKNKLGMADIPWVLRRGWVFPALGALLGLTLAGAFLMTVPAVYKSSARILMDRSVNRYLQTNKIAESPVFDDADIAGQIYVLSSDSVVVPVVRELKLDQDPEFVGRPGEPGKFGIKQFIKTVRNSVLSLQAEFAGLEGSQIDLRLGAGKAALQLDPSVIKERTAVDMLLQQLSVYREDAPNVINIGFSSQDPVKAANIANAIADKYISTVENRKRSSSKMISQLLEERLLELKRQSDDADRALQDFISAHNLVGISVGRVVQGPQDDTAAPSLMPSSTPNDLILKLRSQYVDLETKANELERQLGASHLAVVKLRNQMAEIKRAMKNEDQRNGLNDADQAKLRDLESSAATLHNLYNAALRKSNEVNQIQPDMEEAHIISRASPPLSKSYKKPMLLLGGGLMFGLLSGAVLALGREWLASVFRTPSQVRQATGLYCAVLPKVEPAPGRKGIEDYVLDAPYTRFTESIRNVQALLKSDQRRAGTKVVGVISSTSNEGKTTVVSNLATLMNSLPRARTLIIDGDLHRRTVTEQLTPGVTEGLLEALDEPSRLKELVIKRERSRVDILPCARSERTPHAAELLGSVEMEKLLDVARETYDFIIVEVPPIMSVVDVKTVERFIDSFIFVIEWGETKRELVEEAFDEIDNVRDRILCVLLNKADPAALKMIEAYKGSRIGNYYVG